MFLGAVRSAFGSRIDVALENLALRQQLATFACSDRRPRLTSADRWFRIALHQLRARWAEVLWS